MKNFIQNLVPSKLSYKLACLFIIAMFAGNAQASTIYFAGPPSNNLGGAIVDQFPNETINLAIQGPLFLQSNAVNNLTGSPYTISTASGTTFNNTTDIGTAALFLRTDADSIIEYIILTAVLITAPTPTAPLVTPPFVLAVGGSPFKVIFHSFRSLAVETCGCFGSRLRFGSGFFGPLGCFLNFARFTFLASCNRVR